MTAVSAYEIEGTKSPRNAILKGVLIVKQRGMS